MLNKKYIVIILSIATIFSTSSYEIEKKYYGNIIGGGKEKIVFKNQSQLKNISVLSRNITIDLFEKHSNVKVIYKIKNNGKEDCEISFLYPYMISSLTKIKEDLTNDSFLNSTVDIQKISGLYSDFLIKDGQTSIKYALETEMEDDENNLLFKIGDSVISFENNKWNKEIVDSFNNKYGFYSFDLKFLKKEVKVIQITYKTMNYYNDINVKSYEGEANFEDPVLEYEKYTEKDKIYLLSDRVFSYVLYTPYDKGLKIKNTLIQVNSNIINDDYIDIQPKNYKKSGTSYFWKYGNLFVKPLHNVVVRINKNYAKDVISINNFNITPLRSSKDQQKYYEITKDIVLEYLPENKEETIFNEIRIMPSIYSSKNSILKSNMIRELEIDFYDLNNQIIRKENKVINQKEYFSLLNKKNYITIYDGSDIKCKTIKIKIKNVSNEGEKIVINDIELLRNL